MDAIDLLNKACDETSQRKVADELGISKTSVNLLLKGNYPNPQKMYNKIFETYGDGTEIVGVDSGSYGLKDAARILEELT